MIRAIVAIDEKRGLANDNGIPWQGRIPSDVKYYRDKIKTGTVLMGFGLYKELTKPYDGGVNYVATHDTTAPLKPGFQAVSDARQFIEEAQGDVWNAGGAALFASTLDLIDELYITQLQGDFGCTKFFPEFKDKFVMVSESEPITEGNITFTFQVWRKK